MSRQHAPASDPRPEFSSAKEDFEVIEEGK